MKHLLTPRRLILLASLVASVAGAFAVSHGDDAVVSAAPARTHRTTTGTDLAGNTGDAGTSTIRTSAHDGRITLLALQPRHFDTDAGDLFAVPTPPAPVQTDLRPVAPPLPFTFLGRIADGDRVAVMLGQTGGDTIVAHQGDKVGSSYRLETVGDGALIFIYLPLRQKQTLALSETGASEDALRNARESGAQ